MHPNKITALFKYLDIIYKAFCDYIGTACLSYNQHFCLRTAHDPALGWRIPQWELWAQLVILALAAWKVDQTAVI